ncbi:MAG: bifunctional metallophosphatase/5'-nucleotidase [Raoultibacter sp.]|jgi:5'-nucleotidase/UDP-sugar diphosphatase
MAGSQISRRSAIAGILALVLALALAPFYGCSNAPQESDTSESKLAIIHTNDTHGYDVAAEPTDKTPGVMGMSAVPALVQDYKSQGYEVILLDAGDAIQDTSLVNLSHGASAIEFMNQAGYQAMTLGNHEFDWSADNLNTLRESANFPMLSANIIVEATGETYVDANTIFTLESGKKVGVFGLTTPETQTKSSPKNVAGLKFLAGEDMYACAQEQIDTLKDEGCDIIVCLGHLGSVGGVEPNRSIDVLEHTQGIDLFIDGHDHEVVNETVNGAQLVSTGAHLENIGVVVIEDGTITEKMVTYGSFSGKDQATEDLINRTNSEVQTELSKVVATSSVPLNGERESGVRTQETNLGDLVADAALWQAQQVSDRQVDGAIVNGGSIRASIAAGDISMNDLKTVSPYDNSLNVVTVTGAELLETIEAATYSLPSASAGFPQVAGITYSINSSVAYEQGEQYPNSTYFAPANPGARITITDVGGKGFSLDAQYTIAAASFITDGGDTYYAMAKAYNANGVTTGVSDFDALTNYVSSELGGIISERYAEPQGRISVS